MNQSTFESMSRVLLAIAIAVLAGVFAFGGSHQAIAQTPPTAQCESPGSRKEMVTAMNAMLEDGKTEFVTYSNSYLCGW
jgi:hypothetical protein